MQCPDDLLSRINGWRRRENKEVINSLMSGSADTVKLRHNRLRSLVRSFSFFLMGIAFFIFMWYCVSSYYNTHLMYALKFPTPNMVLDRLVSMFSGDVKISNIDIQTHLEASLSRWVRGFVIGFLIGLLLGVALATNDIIYDFGMVPLSIWQMIPSLAWMPITILILGFGDISAIFIISATIIAPVAINVSNGIKRIPPVYRKLSFMGEKSWSTRTMSIMIPYAATDIVAGLRIGMANGWRTLISAEMVIGVAKGLGFSISITTEHSIYTTAFACIAIICIVGVIIDRLILASIERYVRKKTGMEGSSSSS